MHKWRLIISGPNNGYYNMAVDEAIVIACREGGVPPTLRFYTWDPPCVSIGYFQKIDSSSKNHPIPSLTLPLKGREYTKHPLPQGEGPGEGGVFIALCETPFHDGSIVRRITGGRAVFHGNDLSYSVVCPTQNNIFPNNLKGAYNLIADAFICGLRQLGLQPDTVECKSSKNPKYQHSTLCFDTSLRHEVSFNGKKLIGSAQRRWPDIFLQHGSILIDEDPDENEMSMSRALTTDNENPPLNKGGHGGVFSGKNVNNVISLNKLSEIHLNIKYALKDIINAICTGFNKSLYINLIEDKLTSNEKDIAEKLLKEKYYLPSWNDKRSISDC